MYILIYCEGKHLTHQRITSNVYENNNFLLALEVLTSEKEQLFTVQIYRFLRTSEFLNRLNMWDKVKTLQDTAIYLCPFLVSMLEEYLFYIQYSVN